MATTSATVTILCCDVAATGDDGRGGTARLAVDRLRSAVGEHSGTEVRLAADGLMVAFSSVSDAVACAVTMQTQLARQRRRQPTVFPDLRVGLSVGEVTLEDDDYLGPPVVEAAGLCAAAEAGQILASNLIRLLAGTRGEHRFLAVGGMAVEGVADPVDSVVVEWETPATGTVPMATAVVAAQGTMFVGRHAEVERLVSAWKEASTGTRRAVLIGGEPGVGKSRLAAEVARHAYDAGAVVLHGRCDEDVGAPYQPFTEALRGYVAAAPPDDLRAHAGAGAGDLARLVPDLAERVHDLAPPTRADPDAERYVLFEAVVSFLASVSHDSPVMLVLEDLQWAPKPTLLLLRHLLRSVEPLNLLVIGTYRDTELERTHPLAELLTDLRRDRGVDRLDLGGLDEPGVLAFVETAAGHELSPRGETFARAVHESTGGNPFFLGEIIAHLATSGLVYQENGRWTSRATTIDEYGLPDGVREVILRRVDRLSETTAHLLTLAAVIGPNFTLPMLAAVPDAAADMETIVDALDEAVEAGVLVERGGAYEWAQSLVRQTLYSELTRARRVRLHRRVGEALESLPGPPPLDALARHFAEAAAMGDGAKAAAYALRASEQAMAQLAWEEATGLLDRGLAALDLDPVENPRLRAELLLALGEARNFSGDVTGMKQAAVRAAREARQLGDAELLAQAAVLYTRWVIIGAPDPVASDLCEEALDAIGTAESISRSRLLTSLANYRFNAESDAPRARALVEPALELARRLGDDDAVASALYTTATAMLGDADIDRRRALADELVALSSRTGAARSRLDGLLIRATTRLEAGDLAGYDADIAELERLTARLHWWASEFWALAGRITRAMVDGRFEDVGTRVEDMFTRGAKDLNALNAYSAQLFALRREQGRLSELLAVLVGAVEQSPGLPAFRAALAVTQAELGLNGDARRHLDVLADDRFTTIPRDQTWMGAVVLSAEAAALLGDAERSQWLVELLRPFAGRYAVASTYVVCFGPVDRYLAMALTTAGRLDEARAAFEAAMAMDAALGSAPFLVRTGAAYGRFLLDHDTSEEGRRRGHDLLTESLASAQALGMQSVIAQITATLAET